MLCLLDFFEDLADVAILTFLDRCDFIHHVLEQILHQLLRFLVTVHALINLQTNHFTKLVSNLQLAALEPINFILDSVVDFRHFSSQDNFLLRSGHLFLSDPAVDAPDLCFQVRIQRLDGLVFALELIPDISIHLVVALSHLFNTLSALFTLHALLEVHLVPHIINLPRSLLLLAQKPIHQIRHLDLEPVRHIVLQIRYHISEIFAVFERGNFHSAQVLLLFALLHVHQIDVLLEAHQFALDSLKDLVKEHGRCVTLSIDHLVVGFRHGKSLFKQCDTLLKLVIEPL